LVGKEEDWEEHLQLLHYNEAYHNIFFGSNPPLSIPKSGTISHFNPSDYSYILQGELLELRELVEANTVEAANNQKNSYGGNESLT